MPSPRRPHCGPPIRLCYSWVHRAARILKNEEGLRVEELRRNYRRLLSEMCKRKEEAGRLCREPSGCS